MYDFVDSKSELRDYLVSMKVFVLPHVTHDQMIDIYEEMWGHSPREAII